MSMGTSPRVQSAGAKWRGFRVRTTLALLFPPFKREESPVFEAGGCLTSHMSGVSRPPMSPQKAQVRKGMFTP